MTIPECMNRSQCREIIISAQIPQSWAIPLYGYAMPIIVFITFLTNSFIVLVLSHKYLRTPTNVILLAMAVTELLTALSCMPWLLYYYTLAGYKTDEAYGIPAFWCAMYPYWTTILPSIFHTTAIWLTVYLAAQRYIYICLPKLVRNHCTIKRSKHVIITISLISVWMFMPELFATYNQTYYIEHPQLNITRRACMRVKTSFIMAVGSDAYYYFQFGLQTLFVHTLPCILLVCLTWKLILAIRLADRKYLHLIQRSDTLRKYTLESTDAFITDRSIKRDTVKKRPSFSDSKRVQGLKQNTRMLICVIILFLITEIPAAMIFSLHVSAIALRISVIQNNYALMNKLLIVRNVLIVISYPARFAIYCGMSQQFREVVRQMLTQRVFFPCGKRAQNLMRNIHHSPLNGNNHSNTTNDNNLAKQTIVCDQRSQTSERKTMSYELDDWPTSTRVSILTPRPSLLNEDEHYGESNSNPLIQYTTAPPQFFFVKT